MLDNKMECFGKMAPAPEPLVSVGEFVIHDGRTWLVTDIQNGTGWNQYQLTDMDTGDTAVRARYQLERVPEINLMDDDFADELEADVPPEVGVHTSPVAGPSGGCRRWNERTESDLTKLQENRHSKSTSHQTRWAAKTFRGASAIFP